MAQKLLCHRVSSAPSRVRTQQITHCGGVSPVHFCGSDGGVSITAALSAVAVPDLAEAKEFYSNLFGRGPDLEPMPTLAQCDIENGGGVQVVEHAENSGSSMLTLLVTDFHALLTELSEKGVEHGAVIAGVISRVTQTSDPAGNVITFAEVNPDS